MEQKIIHKFISRIFLVLY